MLKLSCSVQSTANVLFYYMYFQNRYSYYVTKVVGLKIHLMLVRKMAINVSATQAVDLVCDDFFNDKSEREGAQEVQQLPWRFYGEDRELDLLAKAVIPLPAEETTSFQLESYQRTVGSEDTSSYVKKEMEAGIPSKTNNCLHCIFRERKK